MKQQQAFLSKQLQHARERGFVEDLHLNERGVFITTSSQEVTPITIEVIQCHECYATIYLVADEHIRGTWVFQWDNA